MRDLLQPEVSRKALILSLVVSLMAAPQILRFTQGGTAAVLVATAVVGLWAVSGFILAWSNRAGMVGAFPDARKQYVGIGLALFAGLLSIPGAQMLEPLILDAAESGSYASSTFLQFPTTPYECCALMLWSAGFATVFLTAGTASFAARISGRFWVAIAVVVLLRVWITMAKAGGDEFGPLLTLAAFRAAGSLVGVWLFGRFGLIPCMTYGATVCLHHLPLGE